MKLRMILAGLVVCAICVFCVGKKPSETAVLEQAASTTGVQYQLDTVNSIIEWIGSAPGDYKHNGILKFSAGTLGIVEKSIVSGSLRVNMKTISALDQTGKDKENLEAHLMDKDFFEVEKFPAGDFQFVRVSSVSDSAGYTLQIEGNLTLKNVTHPVSFRARAAFNDGIITAESAPFTIDRTKWGIVYHSGIIGTIKDELINDEIVLKVKLIAAQQRL
ncbi:MAG: YceI family protein [Flammeovirgaceae bacterium]